MRPLFLLAPLTALALLGTAGAQPAVSTNAAWTLALGGGGAPRPPEANVNLDGTWQLSGGTALRPVPGSVPELTLAGGRVSGTGGCNRLTGTARVGNGALTLGPLASTRMLCAPDINTQETAFLRFLGQAGLRAGVRGETLTLTDRGGRTLRFRRAAQGGGAQTDTGAVREGTYTLATVNGQPAPQTSQSVTLTLEAGQLGGSDGCNNFSAAYRLEGGRLILTGEPTSTLRACPNRPETMNLPALLAAQPTLHATARGLTLQVDGTKLTFTRN